MSKLYIKIRHWLFWYGHYGFCSKSCNDEITIYLDNEERLELGYFEITTQNALKNYLENYTDEIEDEEYYTEVKNFLNGSDETYYRFIYPRFECYEDDILNQVTHFAPQNEKGHKPIYIYVWTKIFKSLDMDTIKECVKILDKEFLHNKVTSVEILGIPTYEETKISYEQDVLSGFPINE